MVEYVAHNNRVVGSIPTRRISPRPRVQTVAALTTIVAACAGVSLSVLTTTS